MKRSTFVAITGTAGTTLTMQVERVLAQSTTTAQYKRDLAEARRSLASFKASKSLDSLRDAVLDLSHVSVDYRMPQNDRENRRALVSAYAALFNALDQNIDTTFDPNNESTWPSIHVDPPPGDPIDTKPDDISDTHVRAQYETAIKMNTENTEQQRFQVGLRRLDSAAQAYMQNSLSNFRATTPNDSAASGRFS